MSNEKPTENNYFLQIISDFLNVRASNENADADIKTLLKFAKSQEMSGILYYQLNSFASAQPYLNKLESRYAADCYCYSKRVMLLNEIDDALKKAEIPYIIFKGTEISNYYPIPMFRTMGDSDLLVTKENQRKASCVLEKAGFNVLSKGKDDWHIEKDGISFELHNSLMPDDHEQNLQSHIEFLSTVWDNTVKINGKYGYTLDINYHFVYLLLHLRKHIMFRGAGLRQFADIAAVQKCGKLNWEYIEKILNELDIYKFSSVCFGFCKKYFGVDFPFAPADFSDEDSDGILSELFANGVFGFENKEGDNYYDILKTVNHKNNIFYKIKSKIKFIFPSYSTLCSTEQYVFLDGKPFLLPFVWVYRAFYSFKHKKVSYVKKADISDSEINKRIESLKKWGIF